MHKYTSQNGKKYYVYALEYPVGYLGDNGMNMGGFVFYIGKGTVNSYDASVERINQHEMEARNRYKSKSVMSSVVFGSKVCKYKSLKYLKRTQKMRHFSTSGLASIHST